MQIINEIPGAIEQILLYRFKNFDRKPKNMYKATKDRIIILCKTYQQTDYIWKINIF